MNPIAVAAPSEALGEFYRQKVRWEPATDGSAVQEAEVEVPLDYADPAGERIRITVGRLPAADPARRRGVLVALNGGPGGHNGLGRRMPSRFADSALHEVYDVVGFDPRGWGRSAPLLREVTVPRAPWSSRPGDADFELIAADQKAVEEGAARLGGRLRPQVTTTNVARDLDVIRAVLGEEQISLLGYADGTYTSCVYGTMFGDRVDRHVFDSAVDPGAMWRGQYMTQAIAIRRNVDAWAAWVAERNLTYRLGGSAEAVVDNVELLGARLAEVAHGGVDRTVLDGAVGLGATHRPLWGELAATVVALRAGDFAAVKAAWLFAAPEWERPEPGATTQSGVVEAVTSEGDWPKDLEVYYRDMREFREKYPYGYGVLRAGPWVSAFRAAEPLEPVPDVVRDGYGPGLVVHGEGNPTLSYLGGVAMARRLGDALVTVADDGRNEIYGVRGIAAVDELVTAYLVDGVLPQADVVVAGTARPAVPADRDLGGAAPNAASASAPRTEDIERYLEQTRTALKPRV
ncbi:MAG: alpha/beta fold hydrolase [Actinocrinis sp.]